MILPLACDCDAVGTESCNKENGHCVCKSYVAGTKCDACKDGFYGSIPTCQGYLSEHYWNTLMQFIFFLIACGCNAEGTESCNKETGQCICKPNVVGVTGIVIEKVQYFTHCNVLF